MAKAQKTIVRRSIERDSRLYHLYSTGDFSDVVFEVGTTEVKKFHAHKLVFTIASQYFEFLFLERQSEDLITIPIKDMEPTDFDILMRFIYLDEFSVKSTQTAIIIAEAAKRFSLNKLFAACVSYIESNITVSVGNVWEAYDLAMKYQLETLLEILKNLITKEQAVVFNLATFLMCEKEIVMSVAKDVGRSLKQRSFFTALSRWGRVKLGPPPCNVRALRDLLMPFLPHVRFISFSPEEFAIASADTDIFSDEEFTSIGLRIVGFTDRLLPSWCNKEKATKEIDERARRRQAMGPIYLRTKKYFQRIAYD